METVGSKLSDKILAEGVGIYSNGQQASSRAIGETERLKEVIRGSEVFYIQNVADYYRQHMINDFDIDAGDLPCLAPPFPQFFMEFRIPRGTAARDAIGIVRAGVVFENREYIEDFQNAFQPEVLERTKWILKGTTIVDYDKGPAVAVSSHLLPISENGAMVTGAPNRSALLWELATGTKIGLKASQYRKILGTHYNEVFFPGLLALTFTHCKGTTIREENPLVKLSRSLQKKTGHPLIKYHVIDVNPMRDILLREGQIDQVGLPRALHIVRGHFADYRERGLFGKYKGVFWKPDHSRGDVESGIVTKDYRSHTP